MLGSRCSGGSRPRHTHQKHPQPPRALSGSRFPASLSSARSKKKPRVPSARKIWCGFHASTDPRENTAPGRSKSVWLDGALQSEKDIAIFEEDDHPWIEACPRAALVVAILRRIAYTMLALFSAVTQRCATPWQTLMTDLFVAFISTTELELQDPKPLRLR